MAYDYFSRVVRVSFDHYTTIETSRKGKQRKYIFTINKEQFDYHKTLFNFSHSYNNSNDDNNDNTIINLLGMEAL